MLGKHFSNELKVVTSHVEEFRFSEQSAKKRTRRDGCMVPMIFKKLSAGARCLCCGRLGGRRSSVVSHRIGPDPHGYSLGYSLQVLNTPYWQRREHRS